MKKIKLRLSELTNPQKLSAEQMKSMKGATGCSSWNPCTVFGQYSGYCQVVSNWCQCYIPDEDKYGASFDCFT